VKKTLGIIDIEMSNLYSLEKIFKFLNHKYVISGDQKILKKCDKLILPGVGDFKTAMKKLKKSKLSEFIINEVKNNKPILGICLGMQLLGYKSFESGETIGLKLNDLIFKPFKNQSKKIDFHIGFNQVQFPSNSILSKNIPRNSDFYFVHGFYAEIGDNLNRYGFTKYKRKFVSLYEKKNIFGVQFHPEKSQKNGLILIKNFLDYSC
tara:strand:+ start:918 stop:1538 length:621 start_codon:yes stop_codon:yes gene_type:complete